VVFYVTWMWSKLSIGFTGYVQIIHSNNIFNSQIPRYNNYITIHLKANIIIIFKFRNVSRSILMIYRYALHFLQRREICSSCIFYRFSFSIHKTTQLMRFRSCSLSCSMWLQSTGWNSWNLHCKTTVKQLFFIVDIEVFYANHR
jgi:hypothetical protein